MTWTLWICCLADLALADDADEPAVEEESRQKGWSDAFIGGGAAVVQWTSDDPPPVVPMFVGRYVGSVQKAPIFLYGAGLELAGTPSFPLGRTYVDVGLGFTVARRLDFGATVGARVNTYPEGEGVGLVLPAHGYFRVGLADKLTVSVRAGASLTQVVFTEDDDLVGQYAGWDVAGALVYRFLRAELGLRNDFGTRMVTVAIGFGG